MARGLRSYGRPAYARGRFAELAKAATRAESQPLADWAVRQIRLEGRPFSFAGHEYLRAIYNDTSPHVVLCKAAQIGGTTWGILRSIHACRVGLNVIYYFPTRTDVLEFSKSRVGPLLADNPVLARLVSETDTAGLKRIGPAHLYFRGMKSTVGMKSVPADMIVFDELDEATPAAKAMARERLAHSDYKRILELSNPSLPDYGIDEVFQASDQRHWLLKCPACGAWTCLDKEFPAKLGQEVRIILPRPDGSFYRACARCSGELDLAEGEWVPEYPERFSHGYRISQLFSSKVDPGEILREYRSTRYPDRFFNLKIGIPWADLERRLDVAAVLSHCGDEGMAESSDEPCIMGVDTGRALHVVILQERKRGRGYRLVHLGEYGDFADLAPLLRRYRVAACVIDAMPETHATRQFAKAYPGKVFMCFFSESQRGETRWELGSQTAHVNRTEALDASRAAIREGRIELPRQDPLVERFASHLAADAKVLDEDEETGAKRYRYIRTGEDHFSLAFTYAWLATADRIGVGILRHYRQMAEEYRARQE